MACVLSREAHELEPRQALDDGTWKRERAGSERRLPRQRYDPRAYRVGLRIVENDEFMGRQTLIAVELPEGVSVIIQYGYLHLMRPESVTA